MKQTNLFTWKELSISKSQQYKVEESCRQSDRITPFIHFFSSFTSCFTQCRLFHMLQWAPKTGFPQFGTAAIITVTTGIKSSHWWRRRDARKTQVEAKTQVGGKYTGGLCFLFLSSWVPCVSARVCATKCVRGAQCVCARARTVSDRLTFSWRGTESSAHHTVRQTPA